MTDPWGELTPPTAASTITARRVDASLRWGFFWARDIEKHYLLILRHDADVLPSGRLPLLRGIEVKDEPDEHDATRVLSLSLNDSAQRDIFYQLCLDIVGSAAQAPTEQEALRLAVARMWRWHHLLKGGRDGRLSEDAQKGLVGELLVLERFLLPVLPPGDAVRTWRGPLGAPKDFEIGLIAIEAKARRAAATPFIAISSEFQFDASEVSSLFLHVVGLEAASADTLESFTVADIATRIRAPIMAVDPSAAEVLDGLLTAAGFEWTDNYADARWVEGSSHVFQVRPGFPSITPQQLPLGVSQVTYAVSLPACEPYRVEPSVLRSTVAESLRAS